MQQSFLSIGECMIELADAGNGLVKKGYAGDTFNTAFYAAMFLGNDWAVRYFTVIGQDPASQAMQDFIAGTGILTDQIHHLPGRMPGLYMIHLDKGERSFSYWRDNSAAKTLADDPDRLRAAIEQADFLYFSGITLAILSPDGRETLLAELRRAKAAGKPVAFDPNLRPRLWSDAATMCRTIEDGARAATLVFPGLDDERSFFGDETAKDTITRYLGLGCEQVIVKDGANGITLGTAQGNTFVPPVKAAAIVDTTSAGDSFNGAFFARLLSGNTSEQAAAFAADVASRVISHHGALVPKAVLGL